MFTLSFTLPPNVKNNPVRVYPSSVPPFPVVVSGLHCVSLHVNIYSELYVNRAMLHGGSVLNGFDSRNPATKAAKTGGILQILTYLSGLSGGSWMTGSWATASGPTFPKLNADVWKLEVNCLIKSSFVMTMLTFAG